MFDEKATQGGDQALLAVAGGGGVELLNGAEVEHAGLGLGSLASKPAEHGARS
jgi:hypothetical protein